MRIGYDRKNRLLVADDTQAIGRLVIEVAVDRVLHGEPLSHLGVARMDDFTLSAVKNAAITIIDDLRAELLAAEVTMDDLG